jgi:hypothetical protein
MADITAAVDEAGATSLVRTALAAPIPTQTGSTNLGPFALTYSAGATVSVGAVDLIAPNIIRLTGGTLNYSLSLNIRFDLSSILPDFCLPQVCIPIPFNGRLCTPRVCVDWPTISIPISHSGPVNFTSDFSLNVHLTGGQWIVDLVVVGTPFLQLGPVAVALVTAIGGAVAVALLAVPFIGPFLALAAGVITAAFGVAALTGLLGPILTPFIAGLTITIYRQPQSFQVLPAAPPDGAVNVTLDLITAAVQSTDEDELVLTADISA